jgi:hypothetical protein
MPREFRQMAKEADRNHRGPPSVWMAAARSAPQGVHVAGGVLAAPHRVHQGPDLP